MGFCHGEGSKDSEGKKWVITGVAIRAPPNPISAKASSEECPEDEGEYPTTPTARESRIQEGLICPPPPRKRRPPPAVNFARREYFRPPDLELLFMPHVGRFNF